MVVGNCWVETAASECRLNFCFDVIRDFVPAFFSENTLLIFRDSEAGASDGELHNEEAEQDDHVEEEGHLMMFGCSVKATKCEWDQDDSASNDTWNYW